MTVRLNFTRRPVLPDRQSQIQTDRRRNAWRNPLLWMLQGWLAMFYLAAGYAKLTEPSHLLELLLTWPAWVRREFVVGIGLAETGLAIGVLAPALSWRLHPVLLASSGAIFFLAGTMSGLHLILGDAGLAGINAVLMIIAALLLYGRWRQPMRT
ncbi:MAG: DoxX family protein [Brevundimonas sp.]